MDQTLFVIGLVLFAALYIGLAVYLLWTIAITLIVMLVYLAVRYGNIVENYPYNLSETLSSVILISTTWTVFIIVGPKPIEFFGPAIVYDVLPEAVFSSIVATVVVFIIVILGILAIIIPNLEHRGGMGGAGGGGGGGGDLTVGSG